MPLRIRRRKDTGTWEITGTVQPAGAAEAVRVRRRAASDDPKLAAEECRLLEAEILRAAYHGERRAVKSFADAVTSYLRHEPRTNGTKALVRKLLLHFRETPLNKIDQEAVDDACGKVLRPGAAPGTVRRNVYVPLRAVMIHAAKRKWCERPEFDIPSEPKGRTEILMPAQVEAMIEAAPPHFKTLLIFLICTGCRVSEALALKWDQVDLRGARAILHEGETKSGGRRVMRLPARAIAAMGSLPHRDSFVFLQRHGLPYPQLVDGASNQLQRIWATTARKAGLPGEIVQRKRLDRAAGTASRFKPKHTPHVLRHSWASWHYAVNRDLLRLKTEGAWSSVALVERYAHLLPDGQEDAIRAVWGEVTGAAVVERA